MPLFLMKGVKIMHFTGTKYLHEIESLMQGVPGFSVKGHGGIILKKEMEDCIRGQPPYALTYLYIKQNYVIIKARG